MRTRTAAAISIAVIAAIRAAVRAEPPLWGTLVRAGGGTYTADEDVFTADIAADGTVRLRDVTRARPPMSHDELAELFRADTATLGEGAKHTLQVEIMLAIDPSVRDPFVPIAGSRIDYVDPFLRKPGFDPYASRKLAFLDRTRAQRADIGAAHRTDLLRRAPALLRQHLERVARLPDPRARRAALFELWDEAAEAGSSELVAAATAVRAMITSVIRARYAAGSPDQYTAYELAALNRRRQSKTPFAPYE